VEDKLEEMEPFAFLFQLSSALLAPIPVHRTEVEDKLEEMEPGRNHLSGFYIRRGHEVTAGGRRLSHIFLVSRSGGRVCGLSLFWSADLAGGAGQSVDWRERLLPCQAGSACPVLLAAASPPSNQVSPALPRSRIFPQATEIIKSASNIRNTRFHIQRPNMGSVESKRLQVGARGATGSPVQQQVAGSSRRSSLPTAPRTMKTAKSTWRRRRITVPG